LLFCHFLRLSPKACHFVTTVFGLASSAILQACRAVKASRRWAVTGTPLQNRLSDVFGLMVFLGLKPLCDKPFWRATVERPLKVRDPKGLMTLKVGVNDNLSYARQPKIFRAAVLHVECWWW